MDAPGVRPVSLDQATLVLEKAHAQDQAGNYASAVPLYESGIRAMLDLMKTAPNKGPIRSHIEAFLDKAERCKQAALVSSKPISASKFTSSGSIQRLVRQRRYSSDTVSVSHGRTTTKFGSAPHRAKSRPVSSARLTFKSNGNAKPALPKAGTRKSSAADPDDSFREIIESEIIDRSPSISVKDIIGLNELKMALYETIILPKLQPAIFQGLRRPAKAILLFGPPGNGKTMIAKALATEANCTFFSISASTLTSKYVGQGEKLVRALFQTASLHQPAIVFIDEIDSLLSARGRSSEHEASRRLKTEFLVRLDGVSSDSSDDVLIIAATNLPHELDEAVLRRFAKKFCIGLPEADARQQLIRALFENSGHDYSLSASEMEKVVMDTEGYSASDITELCKEAAMSPVRELNPTVMMSGKAKISPITYDHFINALHAVKKTVRQKTVDMLTEWNEQYGTSLKGLNDRTSDWKMC